MADQSGWAAKLLFENLHKKVSSVSTITPEDPLVLYDDKNFPKFIVTEERLGSVWERARHQVDKLFGNSSPQQRSETFADKSFGNIMDEVFDRLQTPIKETLTIALYLGNSAINELSKAVGIEDGIFHRDDTILTVEETETGMMHHFLSNSTKKSLTYQISSNADYENVLLASETGISEHLGQGDYLDRQQVKSLFLEMSTYEQKIIDFV
jgi:hypothetical protein